MSRYVYRRCNIGQVIQGDVYVGDRSRYKAMNVAQLEAARDSAIQARKRAFAAFIGHRTVPWFATAVIIQLCIMVASWYSERSLSLAVFWLVWAAAALLPTLLWMTVARRALWDALQILKEDLQVIEAYLVLRRLAID